MTDDELAQLELDVAVAQVELDALLDKLFTRGHRSGRLDADELIAATGRVTQAKAALAAARKTRGARHG